MRRLLRLASISILCALLLVLSGCADRLTQSNYQKIEKGMSQAQVYSILGNPDNESSSQFMGNSGSASTWKDKKTTITIIFINGKVKLKTFAKNRGDDGTSNFSGDN